MKVVPVTAATQVTDWMWFKHDTDYTWRSRVQNGALANSGWSEWSSGTRRTARLEVSAPAISGVTTRSLDVSATAKYGTSQWIDLSNGDRINGLSGRFDPLRHDTHYQATAHNTDGYNNVEAHSEVVKTLPLPAPSSCTTSATDNIAPGQVRVSAAGAYTPQVRLSLSGTWLPSPQTYTGLGAGFYTGYGRTTDGYNNSPAVSCGSAQIKDPYPTAWGDRAGCPSVGIYITPTSPVVYQVRRASTDLCQARTTVTAQGADSGYGPIGQVRAMYGWQFSTGSRPGLYNLVSSIEGAPPALPAV